MSLDTREKTIGDHKYSVTQFNTTTAMKILRTLKDEIGVAYAQCITGVLSSGDGTVILSTMVRELCRGLDEDGTVELVKRLLEQSGARQDEKEILPTFDDMFAGDLKSLFKLLGFILEVNYGDFLEDGGIGSMIAMFQNADPQENPSTKESPEQQSTKD